MKNWKIYHPNIPLTNTNNGGGGTIGIRGYEKDEKGNEIYSPDPEGHVVYFVYKLHSAPVLARVRRSKNKRKREESPVKSMTEPVVESPLYGTSFLILSVDQDRKPSSTIPTNFIFLIFVVVPPKKKSQKTILHWLCSKNAFDSDDEDDDLNDSVDMEGMTMSTLPLSVFSPPFVHASPILHGSASFDSLTFSSICRSKKIDPATRPSPQTTIMCRGLRSG